MERYSSWSRRLKQHGQGMTEYLIIIALIAIAAIGVYSFFGQTARQQPAATMPEMPAKGAVKDSAGAPAGAAKGAGESKNVGTAK